MAAKVPHQADFPQCLLRHHLIGRHGRDALDRNLGLCELILRRAGVVVAWRATRAARHRHIHTQDRVSTDPGSPKHGPFVRGARQWGHNSTGAGTATTAPPVNDTCTRAGINARGDRSFPHHTTPYAPRPSGRMGVYLRSTWNVVPYILNVLMLAEPRRDRNAARTAHRRLPRRVARAWVRRGNRGRPRRSSSSALPGAVGAGAGMSVDHLPTAGVPRLATPCAGGERVYEPRVFGTSAVDALAPARQWQLVPRAHARALLCLLGRGIRGVRDATAGEREAAFRASAPTPRNAQGQTPRSAPLEYVHGEVGLRSWLNFLEFGPLSS